MDLRVPDNHESHTADRAPCDERGAARAWESANPSDLQAQSALRTARCATDDGISANPATPLRDAVLVACASIVIIVAIAALQRCCGDTRRTPVTQSLSTPHDAPGAGELPASGH